MTFIIPPEIDQDLQVALGMGLYREQAIRFSKYLEQNYENG